MVALVAALLALPVAPVFARGGGVVVGAMAVAVARRVAEATAVVAATVEAGAVAEATAAVRCPEAAA